MESVRILALPKVRMTPLLGVEMPVGSRIIYWLNKQVEKIPESLQKACNNCDRLREQIRNCEELTIDRISTFVDYFNLVTCITTGIDITKSGADIIFSWNNVKMYDVDFEVCCLAYNVIVGLLSQTSEHPLTAVDGVKTITGLLQTANFVFGKLKSLYRDDFAGAIPRDALTKIGNYIESYYCYVTLAVALVKDAKKLLIAKTAKTALTKFERCLDPCPAHIQFLNFLSLVFMAHACYDTQTYAKGLAYGRKAMAIGAETKKQKLRGATAEMKEAVAAIGTMMDTFTPFMENFETENKDLYFVIVPQEVEDIPLLKTLVVPEGSYTWNTDMELPTVSGSLRNSLLESIDSRLSNIRSESERAGSDIEASLAIYPTEINTEMQQMISELYAQRNLARNLADEISKILGLKSQEISRYAPEVFEQFQKIRTGMVTAEKTDLYFETQYGKAISSITGMDGTRQALIQFREQMDQIRRTAEIATEEAVRAAESDIIATILEAHSKHSVAFEQIAQQMNGLFRDISARVKEMKDAGEKNIAHYTAECQSAKAGLTNGMNWYKQVIRLLTSIKEKITGL